MTHATILQIIGTGSRRTGRIPLHHHRPTQRIVMPMATTIIRCSTPQHIENTVLARGRGDDLTMTGNGRCAVILAMFLRARSLVFRKIIFRKFPRQSRTHLIVILLLLVIVTIPSMSIISSMMLILVEQESCILVWHRRLVERCAIPTATTTSTRTTTERVLIILVVLSLLELKDMTRILHARELEDSIRNLILFRCFDLISVFVRYSLRRGFDLRVEDSVLGSLLRFGFPNSINSTRLCSSVRWIHHSAELFGR